MLKEIKHHLTNKQRNYLYNTLNLIHDYRLIVPVSMYERNITVNINGKFEDTSICSVEEYIKIVIQDKSYSENERSLLNSLIHIRDELKKDMYFYTK